MTNEEKAVIEAADALTTAHSQPHTEGNMLRSCCSFHLGELISKTMARRKALKPKPRYYVGATKNIARCNNAIIDSRTETEVSLLEACAALEAINSQRDAITRHFHGEYGAGDATTDGPEQSGAGSGERSRPAPGTPATRHPKQILRVSCDGEKFTVLPESETISMKDLGLRDE